MRNRVSSPPPVSLVFLSLMLLVGFFAQPPFASCQERAPAKTADPQAPKNAAGAEGGEGEGANQAEGPAGPTPVETLQALLESRTTKSIELEEVIGELEAADPQRKAELIERISTLRLEIGELTQKFDSISSGIDVSVFVESDDTRFDLRMEVEGLLRPLVRQLKSATAGPRVIEQLRTRIASATEREELAKKAIENLLEIKVEQGTDLSKAIVASRDNWTQRAEENRRERDVAEFELQNRLSGRKSILETARAFFSEFFQSRGLNLLMGLGAFAFVFLAFRIAHRRVLGKARHRRWSFYQRLANVIWHVLTFVCAIAALMLALFVANDWVLLLIVILFLLGLAWASVHAIPQFFEQIRMLLNLGSVREGERIILNGLPWRVDALQLYTRLSNPELTGGLLRLPIRDLAAHHSRPLGENEPWFPCRRGDWVELSDGRLGEVELQSPDVVVLSVPGGETVSYPTADFLGLSPKSLAGTFRISITFGIDYQHQADCTTTIPEIMRTKLEAEISKLVSPEDIVGIEVSFQEAAASSLDYHVHVDFKGAEASRYAPIRREMARILVDACNENGWVIPFTQLTVHQG